MAQHENSSLRLEIGARIRSLREGAGITSQEELAHRAGLHRTYIGRLERGETGVTIEALAAVLDPLRVNLSDFFAPFRSRHRVRTPRRGA
jgi:transcriptional regulator with XRE-family HTH domain